jgi:signal transduction histidine kinase
MEIDELTSIIFLVAFGMLLLIVIAIIIMQVSSKRILQEKLKQEELEVAHKKELLTHSVETQEKERDRLAAEIHDDITSKLNIIQVHLSGLNLSEPEMQEKIASLKEVVENSIIDSRRIAYDLFPVILDKFGLRTALEELEELTTTRDIKMTLETDISDITFNPSVAVHLYRIVQELLNNTLKYAQCSEIRLQLNVENQHGVLTYQDNGVGNSETIKNSNGMGFKNINLRLSILDGELSINDLNPGIEFVINFKAKGV